MLLPAHTRASDLVDDLVPPVPTWPENLTAPKRMPDGSTLLPHDVSDAVHGRLLYLDAYPGLCRTAVQQMARVDHLDCQADLAVQAVQAQAASDKRNASAEARRFTFAKGATIAGVTAAITAVFVVWAESRR